MIELKNITKEYKTGERKVLALDDVSLQFPNSGFYIVIGETGCGKTTLINILGSFETPTNGEIIVDGTSMNDFSSKMYDDFRCNYLSFISQNVSVLDLVPELTIKENVNLACFIQNRDFEDKKILPILELLKINNQFDEKIINLSGGQIQRSSIVRAIYRNPKMIIADEPTSSLDENTKEIVIEFLKQLSAKKLVVVVSHDLSIINEADNVILLKNGKLEFCKSKVELFKDKDIVDDFLKKDNQKKILKKMILDDNSEINQKRNIIENIVNDIFSEKIKIDNYRFAIIPVKYMVKIILDNLKNRKVRTVIEIVEHTLIFIILSSILILAIKFKEEMLPQIEKNNAIDFNDENVATVIKWLILITGIIILFSIFMSSRSIGHVIRNNKQKIGILRSIGASHFSIFAIYFLEFASILFLALLISQIFLIETFGILSDFLSLKNLFRIVIMIGYWFVISFVSVLLPIIFIAKKSISSILKKN
ncbi:MAG: ATP-binding cassette domain-containing protein [Bacilli bacterium]|nr:ATP-binding cassette domain-containing protein [Bacilli bacterium]